MTRRWFGEASGSSLTARTTSPSSVRRPTGRRRSTLATRLRPDVDSDGHPDARAGRHQATRRPADRRRTTKVLVLTTFNLDEYVYEALQAGASGFLLKDRPAAQLADAVRTVANGEALLAPAITRRLIGRSSTDQRSVRPPRDSPRSPPESSKCYGSWPKACQRGDRRRLSRRVTVKTHVARIFRNSACATASRPSSSPTRRAWSSPATPRRTQRRGKTRRRLANTSPGRSVPTAPGQRRNRLRRSTRQIHFGHE